MAEVQVVSKLLDALAEYRGVTLTSAQKLEIANEFVGNLGGGDDGPTNEEVAKMFLENLSKHIRRVGRTNLKVYRDQRLAAEQDQELDAGDVNLIGPPPPPDAPIIPDPGESDPV